MIAFDTDVFTEILAGKPAYIQRAQAIPREEQSVPVVVVEEILRGRLNAIRLAEAGKSRLTIEQAYGWLVQSLRDFQRMRLLPHSPVAEAQFQQWRSEKIRVPTHDLRIAAICVAESATLVSRNRRDFEAIPGLDVEFW
ncbi:MAG: type II toxin-antitoxin system VapC family toxin [Pirellulaceae bacterium]|nr:type II toxin-antitoxin system VapC family toxin [Pirellulaceae bacterium]